MLHAFCNATIFTGKEQLTDKAVLVKDGIILELVGNTNIPENIPTTDCHKLMIAPGLLDLQVYGGGGFLFSNQPDAKALKAIADAIVMQGTTGFYITLATNSMKVFNQAIAVVKQNPHPALLGIHLEGPFINPLKKGAHLQEYIRKPKIQDVEELLKHADGVLKMMTLAPEMCDPAIIRLLSDHGVVVSAGHSNATFDEALKGFENGIATTTHLFNAMSPIHHRDTGLPGATYLTNNIFASIIADGIHVDFETLAISKKIMKERLFLITDAVAEVNEGAYIHVKQKDRFSLPDGTLSGSCLTLLQAVKNCVLHAGITIDEALRMASTYPARLIHASNLGKIEPGAKANLTIFSTDFEIKYTVVAGDIYKN